MSIFRNTRRITEQAVQKKLLAPSPKICYGIANRNQKDKPLLKKEELQNNQLIIAEVGYKRFNVVRKNIPPHLVSKPRVCNHIANNEVTPRIYYEKANKDNKIEKDENVHRRHELRRNEIKFYLKKITSQQHLPGKDVSRPIVYDMIPHNHVLAQNRDVYKELKDNRNQIIYHRVFSVPDINRQTYVKPFKNVQWLVSKGDEKGGAVKYSVGRVRKISSVNESVYLFKTDRERLRELKKKFKIKGPEALKKS